MTYKRKEIFILIGFICASLILYFIYNQNEEKVKVNNQQTYIEVDISGEIIRPTTLIFYHSTTYGVVFKRIKNLKNEYSDFSNFDYYQKIEESTTIDIPTKDVNNKYNPENKTKICINTASKSELITLYQIGEKRAEKILLYINKKNKIASWAILKDIISVSDESIERIKEQAYL